MPLLDVRTPAEFAAGHIPDAVNMPLFSNEERAVVGTAYKQQSKYQAFILGLEFVGPKMAEFVREAGRITVKKQLAVHCWRGGQRSNSMAWLFEQAGFEVKVLKGGYKQYRNYVLSSFEQPQLTLNVIGGRTGTGKTRVLRALKKLGQQVIDLELLAHHKGSAFGALGESEQPTVEHFENLLHAAIAALDPTKPVWIENESQSIGKVYVPKPFHGYMRHSTLLNLELTEQERIQNLVEEYCQYGKENLAEAFQKIGKKLGGLRLKQALEYLENEDWESAAQIALEYYDKTYQHGLDTNPSEDKRILHFDNRDPMNIAQKLLQLTA